MGFLLEVGDQVLPEQTPALVLRRSGFLSSQTGRRGRLPGPEAGEGMDEPRIGSPERH
jgi:hypothetical protein